MRTLAGYLTAAVAQDGAAEAVRHDGVSLTYSELDAASSALAASLAEAGVRVGDRVALWLAKSIESIVAVYAVLKCGAVYVPIDPGAPVKRAALILSDCAISGLVTSAAHLDLLAASPEPAVMPAVVIVAGKGQATELPGARTLTWEQATKVRGGPPFTSPEIDPGTELAYILYTSGSTGVPKGVMLSHRNATAFVDWAVAECELTARDRLASHAPLHFDLSIFDVFAASAAGAALVLVPERYKALGSATTKFVVANGITVWYSVPGALVRMLEAANAHLLATSDLRIVLFAGEALAAKHLRALSAAVPGAALYNLYGPTETNVCTFHRIGSDDLRPENGNPPPIGLPCPYAGGFLLDDEGEIVARSPGAEGELCVSGDSVMAGYWGREGQPAPYFATVPDGEGGKIRVYRTGDTVRYDDRSLLEFVGRRDHMVKVRGYRVELGEVEAAFLRMDEVQEVACVAVPDAGQGARIEAFLLPTPGRAVTGAEARRHGLDWLPRYMLPEVVTVLDGFPRTSTGKVDRQELLRRAQQGEVTR